MSWYKQARYKFSTRYKIAKQDVKIIKTAQYQPHYVAGCEACDVKKKNASNKEIHFKEHYNCGETLSPKCICKTIEVFHNHSCGECSTCKPDKRLDFKKAQIDPNNTTFSPLFDSIPNRGIEIKTEQRANGIYTDVIVYFYDDEITTLNNRNENVYDINKWNDAESAKAGHKFITDYIKANKLEKGFVKKLRNLLFGGQN